MNNRLSLVALTLLVSCLLTQPTFATNGYFTHGLGVKNKAMAGAGTASPDEAIAAAVNPASAIMVDDDWEVGLSIFSPRRSYSAGASQVNGNFGAFTIGPSNIDSGSEYFPIPYFGKVWRLNDTAAVAVNFYGRGGMNSDYSGGSATLDPDGPGPAPVMTLPGTFGGGEAGVDLMQAFLDVGYAVKRNQWNLGISAVVAMQSFEAKGLGPFAGFTKTFAASGGTVMPTNLTDNGHEMSTGLGLKIGAIYQASDSLNLAFAYQSAVSMSELDSYADLFAEAGGFDIPASVRIGASLQATANMKLHLDYELIWFSETDSVGNGIENLFGCPTAGAGGTDLESCLGGSRGPGFKWDDVGAIKIGAEWALANDMILRAGYSYAEQPIQNTQVLFNILAPGVVEQHLTVGLTKALANGSEFSFAFMYAPNKSVAGMNTFDPTQTLEIEMNQFEIEVAYQF